MQQHRELEEGDAAGPFAVAVAMEKTIDEDTVAKVVVAGSVEMFADSADRSFPEITAQCLQISLPRWLAILILQQV